jgi:hypothetical protein
VFQGVFRGHFVTHVVECVVESFGKSISQKIKKEKYLPQFHVGLDLEKLFKVDAPGLTRSGLEHEPPKLGMKDGKRRTACDMMVSGHSSCRIRGFDQRPHWLAIIVIVINIPLFKQILTIRLPCGTRFEFLVGRKRLENIGLSQRQ